jgi:hypothetical protein
MAKWNFLGKKTFKSQNTKVCSGCEAYGSGNENFCVKCGSVMLEVTRDETAATQTVYGETDNSTVNTPEATNPSYGRGPTTLLKNRFTRRAASIVGVISAAIVLAASVSTSFQTFVFGRPTPVTVRVPVPITQTATATWGIGACLALSGNGQSASPVLCSEPHYEVVTSEVTSKYDCPFVTNYSGSYTAHAQWYGTGDGVHLWCVVKVNISQQ